MLQVCNTKSTEPYSNLEAHCDGVNRIPIEGVPTLSGISASMAQGWVTQVFYFTAKARSYEDFLMGAARRFCLRGHREIRVGWV